MKHYDSWDWFTITGRGRVALIQDEWSKTNKLAIDEHIMIDNCEYRVGGIECQGWYPWASPFADEPYRKGVGVLVRPIIAAPSDQS